MKRGLILFFLIATTAHANAKPSFICAPDELRVARCESVETANTQSNPGISVEQMLVCQNGKREFSLRARYQEPNSAGLKETAPIPAEANRMGDIAVEYVTKLGFNLILSASREQAVIRHCVPTSPGLSAKRANLNCQDRIALCK